MPGGKNTQKTIPNSGGKKTTNSSHRIDFGSLPKLLTIKQVSEIFGVHPNTIRNWDRTGKLTAVRIGSRQDRRYECGVVRELYEQEHGVTPPPPTPADPEPYENGKYVLDSKLSVSKIKLRLVSKKFSVFVYSAGIVAFAFVAVQAIFFSYVYTIQAGAPEQKEYSITLEPATVSGWQYPDNARYLDLPSTAGLGAFTDKNSAVYANRPVQTAPLNQASAEQGTTAPPETVMKNTSSQPLPATESNPQVLGDEVSVSDELIATPVEALFEAGDYRLPDTVPADVLLQHASVLISLAADTYAGNEDVITFLLSVDDGQTWEVLGTQPLYEAMNNSTNEGYWKFSLMPYLESAADLSRLRFGVRYDAATGDQSATAYLDAVVIEAGLQEPHPASQAIQESVTIADTDLAADEDPVIDVAVEEEAFFDFLGADPTTRDIKKVEIISPDGETIDAPLEKKDVRVGDVTKAEYTVDTSVFDKPGKYRVALTIEQDGVVEQVVEEFTWGVLAFNPDQSIYQTGQDSLLSIGVLDDAGDMVCDAEVNMTITSPSGRVTMLTTTNGSISVSEYCRFKGDYRGPDYYGNYSANTVGQYDVRIEATHANGTRVLDDLFWAEDDPAYTIRRDGPTRVFPYIYQPMKLEVYAQDDYEGEIVEVVPGVYDIEILDDATIREVPRGNKTVKEIVWNRIISAGQTIELNYNFKTPEVSPALYLVGPARVGDWDEGRQWQMAIDVVYMYVLANTASAPTGWTDDTATFDSDFLRGAASFSVTGGGNATHSHTIHHTSVSGPSSTYGTTCSRRCSWVATSTHTHLTVDPSVDNADNNPAHHTFYIWKNDTGVPTTIPDNSFGFFDADPGGSWTRFSSADSRLVRLDNSHTTGGSDTHEHVVTWNSLGAVSGTIQELDPLLGDFAASDSHTHSAPDPSRVAGATSIPAYVTSLIYEQTNTTAQTIPSNFIGLFDGDPGTGWNVISDGAAEDYYQRFIRGHATTEGTQTGANTHSHSGTTSGPSGTPSATVSASGGSNYASGTHTHTITAEYNSADHTPPYVDFVIAQCDGCVSSGITLSGTAYQEDESTNVGSGVTVQVDVNGVSAGSDTTDTNGDWSVTGVSASSGDIITVYLDDHGTYEGTTVFKTDGTNQTNIDVFQNAVIVRNDTGASITNTNLESGDRDAGDDDIKFDVSSGNVTFDSGFELHVWTGDTYDPGGTVTTQGTGGDVHVDDGATLYLDTATNTIAAEITIDTSAILNVQQTTNVNGAGIAVDVTGTLNHTAATFTIGNSTDEDLRVNSGATVNLSGGTTVIQDLLDIDAGDVTISNTVDINDNIDMDGGTLEISSVVDVADDFDMDGGTLDINSGADIDLEGSSADFLVDGASTTVNLNDGSIDAGRYFQWNNGATINLYGGSHHTGAYGGGTNGSWEMQRSGSLTFNMISGTNPDANGCNITASNILIYNGGTFTTSTVTGGAICQGTTHTQRLFYDVESESHSFYNLKIIEDAAIHTSTTQTIPIANSFTIDSGVTFSTNDKNMKVDNGWINNGAFTAGTSTITLAGGSISGTNDTTFNNLTIDPADFLGDVDVDSAGTDDPIVSGTLNVATGNVLSIESGRTLTVDSSAIFTFSGYIDGEGTLVYKSTTAFPTTGSIASNPPITIRFDSTSNNVTMSERTDYQHVEIYGNATSNTVTAASGTIEVDRDLTLTQDGGSGDTEFNLNTNDPTFTVTGTLTINPYTSFAASNTAALNINGNFAYNGGSIVNNLGHVYLGGSSPQTINTGAGLLSPNGLYHMTITNTSGTDPDTDPGVIFTGGDVEIQGTLTITTQGVYIRFNDASEYSAYGISINGQSASGVTFRSDNPGTQYDFTYGNLHGQSIVNIDVQDSNACGGTTIDVTDSSNVNSGNNNCWDFGPVNISGTIYSDTGSTQYDCSANNLTVSIKVNGAGTNTGTCTAADGSFTVSSVDLSAEGDIMTVFLDNETPNATTVTEIQNPYDDISDFDLYQNNLITRTESAFDALSNTELDNYDSGNDSDVIFTVTSGNLTVSSGSGLYIWASSVFQPGGTVTTSPSSTASGSSGDVVIATGANLNISSNALSVGGDFDNSGTFGRSIPHTTTFTATGTGFGIDLGGTYFDDVVFNGSGGGWSFTTTGNIYGDLTMTAGTLSGTADIYVDDHVTGDGTINLTGGTFQVSNGSNNFGGDTGWTFYNLTFGHSGTVEVDTTATGSGSITVTNVMTLESTYYGTGDDYRSHNLNAGSKDWILSGSGRPLVDEDGVSQDSFIAQTSTVRYMGTSATNIEPQTYNNVEFKPTGGSPTYTVYGTFIAATSNMVVGDGTNTVTFEADTYDSTVDVDGTFSCTTGAGTNTVTTGTDVWTMSGNMDLSNCDTFNATSGNSIVMDGASKTLYASGKMLYDFTASGSVTIDSGNVTVHDLSIGGSGSLTSTNGILYVQGSWSNSNTFTHNSGTVQFTTTATATISGSTTFNDFTVSGIGAVKTMTFTAGTTQTISGTWTVTGASGQLVTLQSSTTSAWTVNPTAADVSYVDVSYSTNTGVAFCATYSNDGGNNTDWSISAGGSCGATISGTLYSDEGTTAIDCSAGAKTVNLRIDGAGADTTECSAADGGWSITGLTIASGDVITVYLENETEEGTTVYVSDGTDQSNVDVYQDWVIVRADTGSITNANLATGDDSDDDVKYAVSTNNLTIDVNVGLHVWNSDTYAPGGTVTTQQGGDIHIDNDATFNATDHDVTIGGSWRADTIDAYIPGSNTTKFTSTSTGETLYFASTHNNMTFDGVGGEWEFENGCGIDGNLTVTNGTIIGDSNIQVDDDVTGNGTINMSGGSFNIVNGSNNFGGDSAWAFYDLIFQHSGTTDYTTSATGSGSITITNQLTIQANYSMVSEYWYSHQLAAGGKDWILSGSGTVFHDQADGGAGNGSLDGQTSTFKYTGTSATTIEQTKSYNNLYLQPASGTPTYTFNAGNYFLTGDLTIQTTVSADTADLIWTDSGTLQSNGATFNNLVVDSNGGAATVAVETDNITIDNQLYVDTGDILSIDSVNVIWTGSSFTLNGSIVNAIRDSGYLVIDSATVIPTGGVINTQIRFDATNGNTSTMPARSYGGSVELYTNSGTTDRTIELGAGEHTIAYNLTGVVENGNSLTIDGATNNPTMNITGSLSFSGVGDGSPTITSGTGTWTVTDDVDFTGGDYTAATGNVLHIDDAATLTTSGDPLYDFQTSGAGTITVASAVTVNNDVTVGSGSTLSGSNNFTVKGGDLTGDGVVDWTGATFRIAGTGNMGGASNWTFNNLEFYLPVCGAYTTTATGTGSVTVNGTLAVASCFNLGDKEHTLNAGPKTWIITGTGTPITTNGRITGGTSTFRYTGAGATNIDSIDGVVLDGSYYNLEIKPSGTATHTLPVSGDLDINNNLIIGDGTNAATLSGTENNPSLDIGGSVSCAGTGTNNINTGTGTYQVTGDVDLTNCTVTATTDHTFHMDGASKSITPGGQTIYNYKASSTGTISQVGAMDVDGTFDLADTAAFTQAADSDLNVAGNFTLASGTTFTKASGTGKVVFDGDLTFTDSTATLQDMGTLWIGASPDTTDLSSDLKAKSLRVGSSDIFNTNGYDVAIETDILIDGVMDATDDGEGDATFIELGGDFTVSSGARYYPDTSTITFNDTTGTSNLVISPTCNTCDLNNVTVNDGGGGSLTVEVEDPITLNGNLTITDGTLDVVSVENNAITVGGNWSNSDTFEARSGTVTFDASSVSAGTVTIDSTGATKDDFYAVVLNDAADGDTFQLESAFDVNDDLTITGGTLDTKSGENNSIAIGGDWTNNDTFTARSSTVTADGSAQQTFEGTLTGAGGQFYNLTITNAGGSDPDVIFGAAAQTANNFTANTASTQLQFNAGSDYTFNNIDFDGQAEGTRVFLRSSSTGTQWNLISSGTQFVSNTDVRDSNACGGDTIDATDGTNFDATNNDCWNFNTLSFSIADTGPDMGVGFGSLSSTAATWATGDETGSATATPAHTLQITTNADNGYSITYSGSTLTNGSDSIDVATWTNDENGTPGTEQFAISASAGTDATIAAGYDYDTGGAAADYTFIADSKETLVSESTATATETISLYYIANISGQTEAGQYTTSITFIATANF